MIRGLHFVGQYIRKDWMERSLIKINNTRP